MSDGGMFCGSFRASEEKIFRMYGVMLWEMVTIGETPHENESAESMMARVICPDPAIRHLPIPDGTPPLL